MIQRVLNKKSLFIIAILAILVGGIATAGYVVYSRQRDAKNEVSRLAGLCLTDDIGKEYREKYYSSGAIDPEGFDALSKKITGTSKYETSLNCLYILTKHGISLTDIKVTELYYNQLTALADHRGQWADTYVVYETREQLAGRIDLLRTQGDEQLKTYGGFYFTPETQ